ncbi:MAG TPA: chemotaxis protein CheW [Pirellulales bacterium]|nr:chemotaxis protein CheW [Pirellulales bacterium]
MRVAESIRGVHSRVNQPSRAGRKVLIFRLSGQAYGISVLRVREILPMPLLEHAPGLPPVLAGFVNLGGEAIPVVNLARLFAVAEQSTTRYTPLVILHYGDGALALLVDSVQGVVRLHDEELVPFSDNLCLNSCAEGLATVGEISFVLLADDRLLREQEQRRIEELAAIEQARLDGLRETSS